MTTHTFIAPSHWAPYLINGDDSGMGPEDKTDCDAWLEWVGMGGPAGCVDAGFYHNHSATRFGVLPSDCCIYTFLTK